MKLTQAELQEILAKHQSWLLGQADGVRANLYGADLSGANLSGANLSRANLSRAKLSRADLYGADLSGAKLSRANLYGADLSGANLYGANLYGANLSGANLSGADLYGANLSRANLSRAKLSEHWKVETYRDLLWIGPLGSRNDFLMVNLPTLRLKAGCFEGTVEDFLTKVAESHGDNEYGREYGATVVYLRALVEARRKEGVAK